MATTVNFSLQRANARARVIPPNPQSRGAQPAQVNRCGLIVLRKIHERVTAFLIARGLKMQPAFARVADNQRLIGNTVKNGRDSMSCRRNRICLPPGR